MLKTFEEIKKTIKFRPTEVVIDSPLYRLHYRATFLILLITCVLVTSQQYIGEHIHCINDKGVPQNVMNTFCFFTTTFTVPKHYNLTMMEKGAIPHPGVGTHIEGEDEIIHHAYYQWVPFVLFLQAFTFYIPHYIWKRQEGGRLKNLVSGLQFAHYALIEKPISTHVSGKNAPSTAERDKALDDLTKVFIQRLHVNEGWSYWFVICEVLYVINLILQVVFTDWFLTGQFFSLGPKVIHQGLDEVDILDQVFPKVTKCTFHKYGPSGTIQAHDGLCVMALNIINEKIFVFLWFWYLILGCMTLAGLMWRILTLVFHSRSYYFNKTLFAMHCPGELNPWQVLYVTKECHFADWLFLYYLSKNMDGLIFKRLFVGMAERIDSMNREESPLVKFDSDEKIHEKSV